MLDGDYMGKNFYKELEEECKNAGIDGKVIEVPDELKPTPLDFAKLNSEIEKKLDKNDEMRTLSEIYASQGLPACSSYINEKNYSKYKDGKSRLYGAKILSDRWNLEEVKQEYYHTYILRDEKLGCNYRFNNIIGFEQVGEDEFLVFDRASADDFRLVRFKLNNNHVRIVFSQTMDNFYFISEDKMLLTYNSRMAAEIVQCIYSISNNDQIPEAEWLKNSELVRINSDGKKIALSKSVDTRYKVVFNFDNKTFKPSDTCYSLLRNKQIKISSVEDLKQVIADDEKYSWNMRLNEIAQDNDNIESAILEINKEKILKM